MVLTPGHKWVFISDITTENYFFRRLQLKFRITIILFLFLQLSSCSTIKIHANAGGSTQFSGGICGDRILYTYGGIHYAVKAIVEDVKNPDRLYREFSIIFYTLDFPVSFVADTLLIPVSASRDVIYFVGCKKRENRKS